MPIAFNAAFATSAWRSASTSASPGSTGAWTTLAGVALTQSAEVPTWIGVPGIVTGTLRVLCALEFVGRHERTGWKLAERLTPIVYVAWSLWLIATGVALLA